MSMSGSRARRQVRALPVLALDRLAIRFAELARGFGLEAVEVDSAEALDDVLGAAMAHGGPMLIEAVIPDRLVGEFSPRQPARPEQSRRDSGQAT